MSKLIMLMYQFDNKYKAAKREILMMDRLIDSEQRRNIMAK